MEVTEAATEAADLRAPEGRMVCRRQREGRKAQSFASTISRLYICIVISLRERTRHGLKGYRNAYEEI